MCGRFVQKSDLPAILRTFQVSQLGFELQPSYNIAPREDVVAVIQDGGRRLACLRWGLIPSWAKDPAIGDRLINARAETVAVKPSFRSAFRHRRCLIVADGFYEWQKQAAGKVPMYVHLKSGRPFGFAGLYEHWAAPGGERISSCTIITTGPNAVLEPIHNRMPVILPEEHFGTWLDPAVEDSELLLPLLRPYPAEEMAAHAVSRLVNRPQNNSPELIQPVATA